MLKTKLENKESGILLYGLTPPKTITPDDKVQQIAHKQIERLQGVDIDGLILYDIQDETARNASPRPFPYMPTRDPLEYSKNYLQTLDVPKIIYKSVGKYSPVEFEQWLNANEQEVDYTVFVGSPSKDSKPALALKEAYAIYRKAAVNMRLGGVTIPERHNSKGDEHERIFSKVGAGCSFFISQCVYHSNNAKSFLSDYYYAAQQQEMELKPIIFTLTPCGSVKTMEFMEWLGIDIPRWLANDLRNSKNILSQSIHACEYIAEELVDYCKEKQIPFGFNIESVAIRKEEIEASIALLKRVKELMA